MPSKKEKKEKRKKAQGGWGCIMDGPWRWNWKYICLGAMKLVRGAKEEQKFFKVH